MSKSIQIVNYKRAISGIADNPFVNDNSILIRDGMIVESLEGQGADLVIDANGGTVIPGLIDAHSHPVLGDYTPRQNSVGWTTRSLHGGVTSLISAGETHWPGRSKDGIESAAICRAAFLSSRKRQAASPRIFGGALLLDEGISEDDIRELHNLGVRTLGEIGLGSEKNVERIAELVAYARSLGWIAPLHFGGASVPGSSVVDVDMAIAVNPSVISHANGGPTSRPFTEIETVIENTDAAIEIVFAGNTFNAVRIVKHLRQYSETDRLQFGTDTPSGTGVVPLGVLRILTDCVSLAELDPVEAICLATGSVATRYKKDGIGVIAPNHYGDITILSAPLGCCFEDPLIAMKHGNVPAVAAVVAEGQLEVLKSTVSPPPESPALVTSKS